MLLGRYRAWRALLLLAVSIAVRGARPSPLGLREQPFKGGSLRELLGIYNLEACAWIQDSVCQLEPDYGQLLFPGFDERVHQYQFEESECLTSRLKGDCESAAQCKWVKVKKEGICVLKNDRLKEIAESCSEDELKPLISLHTRCKSFRVSNCPTDIGCDVAKLPYEGRGCRISGTVMIDKLLNSQISQTDLLQLLVTGVEEFKALSIPLVKDAVQVLNSSTTLLGETQGRFASSVGRRLHQVIPSDGPNQPGGSLSFRGSPGGLNRFGGDTPSVSFAGAKATGSNLQPDDGFTLSVRPDLASKENGGRDTSKPEDGAKAVPDRDPEKSLSLDYQDDDSEVETTVRNRGDTQLASRVQRQKPIGDSEGLAAPDSTLPRSTSQDGKSRTENSRRESVVNFTRGGVSDEKGNGSFISLTAPGRPGLEAGAGTVGFDLNTLIDRYPSSEVVTEGNTQNNTDSQPEGPKNPADIALSSDDTRNFTSGSDVDNEPSDVAQPSLDINTELERAKAPKPNREKESPSEALLPGLQESMISLSAALYEKAFNEEDDSFLRAQEYLHEAMEHLNDLRERLDTNDLLEEDKKFRDAADEIWWKLIVGAQDISPKDLSGAALSKAISSFSRKIEEVYFQVNSTWSSRDVKTFSAAVKKARKNWKEAGSKHQGNLGEMENTDSSMETPEIHRLGDLISLFVKSVNQSFQNVYPIQLDSNFVEEFHQPWIQAVANRNQKWHDIRRTINSISTVGEGVQHLVSRMHAIVSNSADKGVQDALEGEEGEIGEEQEDASNIHEPYHRLRFLVDDIVGALVAIYDGNYTISHLLADKSILLENWPPITRDHLWGVIQNVTSDMQSTIGGFLKPIDELSGVLEAVVLITEAKIFSSSKKKPSLSPSPQEEVIVLLLDRIQHVAYEWSYENNAQRRNSFGGPGATKAVLDLSACRGLGGVNPASCNWLQPSCELSELSEWTVESGSKRTDEAFCRPETVVPKLLYDGVKDQNLQDNMSSLMHRLLEASSSCVLRSAQECEKDDLCQLSNTACQLSSSYANFELTAFGTVALGSGDEMCRNYLDLPNCYEFSHSSYLCNKNRACVWVDPSHVGKTPIYPDNSAQKANGTAEHKKGSQKHKGNPGGAFQVQKDGQCISNWVHSMLVVDEDRLKSSEGFQLMLSKHQECLQQGTLGKCRDVNAPDPPAAISNRLPSKVPQGNTSVSEWGLPVISVLGTVLTVGTLFFVFMLWKRRRDSTSKKGGKQLKSKKGAGKSGKKGQAAAPVPARRVLKFTATVVPTSLSSHQNEVDDFSFNSIVKTLSESPGSQASSGFKASNSPPCAEILPATGDDEDDDSEFDTQSDCSSSSCEGWSD